MDVSLAVTDYRTQASASRLITYRGSNDRRSMSARTWRAGELSRLSIELRDAGHARLAHLLQRENELTLEAMQYREQLKAVPDSVNSQLKQIRSEISLLVGGTR